MHLTTLFSVALVVLPLALARPWVPGDKCPTTIRAVIGDDPCRDGLDWHWCSKEPEFLTIIAVHAALLNCPRITALDLCISTRGSMDYTKCRNLPFNLVGGELYPKLKSVRLENYEFDTSKARRREFWHEYNAGRPSFHGTLNSKFDHMTKIANKWLQYMKGRPWKTWAQWLVSGQEQRKKSHLDLWTDAMDWSQVEELRIDPIEDEVLEKLPGRLTGLRKLETANMSFLRAMKDNTLTQLTWIERSNSKNLPFLLEHQGISLQRLEFRCDELACPNFTPNFDISIIANMTRNLTHLSINVARNGTWPLETLQAIAKLQHLRSADLYFNIQSSCAQERESDYLHFLDENYCKEEDQFQRPFVDKEGAEELFSYMRKHSQGEELTHVTFWVGDWASPSDGLVHPPPWAQDRRSKITCSTEKKGKNDVRCVVESGDKYWEHKWAGGQYRKIVWAL